MNWPLFQNSLIVATTAAAIALVVGIFTALCASGLRPALRKSIFIAAIVILALPPFLVTNTWLHYFGLNGSLRAALPFDLFSLPGTVLIIATLLWPIPFIIILARLARLEKVYLEQDSALRGLNLIRYLLWPHCRSAILQSFAIAFVLALSNFAVPALLQTKVYAAEAWLRFNARFNFAEALLLSWPLIIPALVLLFCFRATRIPFVFRTTVIPDQLMRARLGNPLLALSTLIASAALFLSLALPAIQLATSPRTWAEFIPAIAAGKSATLNSLLIASSTAFAIVALGLLTSRLRAAFWSWLLFLVPGVLLGIAFIWLFNRPGLTAFYQSIGVVLLAFTLRYLCLGWSAARIACSTIDPRPREILRVFGASRFAQFRFAEWPQMKLTLLAAFYLVYLFCLWEVEALILIVPPGRETLSLRIFNMLHYGHAAQIDALCVWLLLLAIAPLALWSIARLISKRAVAFIPIAFLFTGCSGSDNPNHSPVQSQIFSSVQVIGSRGAGAGQFNKPRSLAVDREDNLYVVDITGRVQKFSPDGKFILLWQMPETDKGKAKGMMQDADGNVIVVEPHYSRVNHYDASGQVLAQWGAHGTNSGEILFPRSAAINSRGEIYLSEYGQLERIHHFTHRGTNWLRTFGARGTGPGELNRPEGLGIDSDDLLYVADSCNHRVQILSPEGKYLGSFGNPGSRAGEMSYPYDVRIDPLGFRYVCEFGNSRVQIFDSNNQPLEILGGAGADPGQMNNPWAIALDSTGNLYVADSLNHRVQKFFRKDPLPRNTSTSRAVPNPRKLASLK